MITVSGVVIEGKKKGRELGFPTANIALHQRVESGVYAGWVISKGRKFSGAIFIGQEKNLEIYIFNFSEDIYGQKIEVAIGQKIREVRQFDSERDLVEQIKKDLELIMNLTRSKQSAFAFKKKQLKATA